MKKVFLLSFLLTTSLCTSVNAQTIIEALGQTYKSNPSLQAQRAYLRSVDENVAIAKSGYRPNVYLQGSYGEGNMDNKNLSSDYDYNTRTASANIEQPLFRGFRTVNSVKSADSYVRSEQENLYSVEQSILLEGASAYLDVLRDAAIVELQKNNERLLKKRLDETLERFNVGEVTRTDVAQARARHSRARSDRIAAEGVLAASKANYSKVVGDAPGKLQEPVLIKAMLPGSFSEALEYTKKNNYSIRQAKHYLNSKTYDVATNTGALLPTANLLGTAANSKTNAGNAVAQDSKADNYEVSANVRIPLYAAGEDRAKIRQSKYQKWQAYEQVLVTEREAIANVTSSWEYMRSNDTKIKSIQEQVKANGIALDGVQKEEALGNRTLLDVLDAYQELLNSNVEEVKARRDYYVSAMGLLMSMGKFTAEDLNLDVKLYDHKQHYKDTRDKWLSTGIDTEQ